MAKTVVIVPNWNGDQTLRSCLDSLISQTVDSSIVVVDNGSSDNSLKIIQASYPQIDLITNSRNLGFAGGVNAGIKKALNAGFEYIALFNNDAVADKNWLSSLVNALDKNTDAGIVTCKFISLDRRHLDSTGDFYTNWGLPYPRGRGEDPNAQYDDDLNVFAASGGASLYRSSLFKDVGLFDEDFFAYYEDIDLSFRAQLYGWKVVYAPDSIAYHETGTTSGKIKGFTTYQTMKNLPWLYWKNVPTRYLFSVGWRFKLAYFSFYFSALLNGRGWSATKGLLVSLLLFPKKLVQRRHIQSKKKVSSSYIWSIMTHDLPPNAKKLRSVRTKWWKIIGKN